MHRVGGPGPAAYDPSTSLTMNRKPSYSMPHDPKFTKTPSKSPGPAEYNGKIDSIKPKRAEHTIAIRPYSREADDTPGPAKYQTDVSFASQSNKAQSFTKQIVHNKPKPVPTPGPSMYTPKDPRHRVPAYSIRKKTSNVHTKTGTDEHVGPSSYEVKVPRSFTDKQVYTSTKPGRSLGIRRPKADGNYTPGPSAYFTTDEKDQTTPSYTFGASRQSRMTIVTPGPASYDPDQAQRKKISKSMSTQSLHGTAYTTNNNPGPSQYNTRESSINPVLSKSASSPAITMAKEKRFAKNRAMATPGPGHYSAGSKAIKQKRRGPAFTMAGRWKTKKDVQGGPGPAPAGRAIDSTTYQRTLKSRTPAYSMAKGREAHKSRGRSETPGPGAYFDKAEQSGTIRRSASGVELSQPRGMAFGLKARSKTPDMSPGPASYTPYTTQQLGASGSKHTMKARTPHPNAITTSVYSQSQQRPKKTMTKTITKTIKARPVATAY